MRIGLDIDNVITAFDDKIFEAYLEEDKNKRNCGIIHPEAVSVRGLFDWSDEEAENFYIQNMERLASSMHPREGAKEYMCNLLEEGHELYLLSHRVYPHYQNPEKTTRTWFEEQQIPYTKLVLTKATNKSEECLEHQIDIMFDDRIANCLQLKESGIKSYVMGTAYNKLRDLHGLPIVHGWVELYNVVKEFSHE